MRGARGRERLLRSPMARLGVGVVGALVAFCLLGPWVIHKDPLASDFVHGVEPATGMPVGPSLAFPLGADRLFRDMLARLAWGGRLSLTIAVAATLLATFIGAGVGIVAGWNEGKRERIPWPLAASLVVAILAALLGRPTLGFAVLALGIAGSLRQRAWGPKIDLDGWLMRGVDVMLAFPFLVLVMAIGAALEKTSAATIFVTLGLTGWLGTARIVRAKTMQVRTREFVLAARALGQPTPMILWRHILPNVAGTLVVLSTLQVAQMIVADSVLSYLGVGIAPPTPTWGRMLFDGQNELSSEPWLVLVPGAAILIAVLGFNLLGEGLRDALDPHEA